MTTADDKRIDWLKYINTFILTMILGFTLMCFTSINQVRTQQVEMAKELVRIKTIQDANTLAISILSQRLNAVEINQIETLKVWTELNFMRKPQK